MGPQHLVEAPPSSLRSLVHQNPRERLWVRPLCWRQKHLDLLNCQFSPATKPPFSAQTVPSWFQRETFREIRANEPWECRADFLENESWNDNPDFLAFYEDSSMPLTLRIGQIESNLHCSPISLNIDTPFNINFGQLYGHNPVCSVVSYEDLEGYHKLHHLAGSPERHVICRPSGKSAVETRPYLFAVLIALAQARRKYSRMVLGEDKCRPGYKVGVVLTRARTARLFWTTIPSPILAKFNNPNLTAPSPQVIVESCIISHQPDRPPPRWVIYRILAEPEAERAISRLIQQAEQHGFKKPIDWKEVSGGEFIDDEDSPNYKMMEEDKGDSDEAYEFSPNM